jgi:transcription factor IIIB subunit 2
MDAHESSAARGFAELSAIAERFHMAYDIVDAAHRLYKLALQKGFTRGRRVNQASMFLPCQAITLHVLRSRGEYMLSC